MGKLQKSSWDSYIIDHVELWAAAGVQKNQQIWVEQGRLKEIGENLKVPSGIQRIDGGGKVLLPAGVDAQVHLRVPGQAQKELPETGLLAALRGGYCALLTMPNTQPTIDSVETLNLGQEQVRPYEREYGVHVFWSAAITKHLNSDQVTDFENLVRAGVRAFTNDGLGVDKDDVMDQAFARLEKIGVPLLQHAEFLGHGGTMAPGPIQQKVGATPYPDEPEWKMVERDIRELRKYPGARYHVLHVSSAKTLELVKKAKAEGLKVTCEVTPHHLFFNTTTLDPNNTSFKMNPPIRSPEDQKALWAGLESGVVDFVSTDHAPHEPLMKAGHFDKVAFGTIGMETTLAVLWQGVKDGRLSRQRLVEVFSTRPAAFLRLPAGLGDFVEGQPFHATWFDAADAGHTYTEDDFSSRSKNSCFIGSRLPGKILGAFHESYFFRF